MPENFKFHPTIRSPQVSIFDMNTAYFSGGTDPFIMADRPVHTNEEIKIRVFSGCHSKFRLAFAFTDIDPDAFEAANVEDSYVLDIVKPKTVFHQIVINKSEELFTIWYDEQYRVNLQNNGSTNVVGQIALDSNKLWIMFCIRDIKNGTLGPSITLLESYKSTYCGICPPVITAKYLGYFHSNHGIYIKLSRLNKVATCIRNNDDTHMFLFSNDPIKLNQSFSLKAEKCESLWFGFVPINPEKIMKLVDMQSLLNLPLCHVALTKADCYLNFSYNEKSDLTIVINGVVTKYLKRDINVKKQQWALIYLSDIIGASVTLVTEDQPQNDEVSLILTPSKEMATNHEVQNLPLSYQPTEIVFKPLVLVEKQRKSPQLNQEVWYYTSQSIPQGKRIVVDIRKVKPYAEGSTIVLGLTAVCNPSQNELREEPSHAALMQNKSFDWFIIFSLDIAAPDAGIEIAFILDREKVLVRKNNGGTQVLPFRDWGNRSQWLFVKMAGVIAEFDVFSE